MLNNENSIEVRNVSKSFKVYFDKGNELKEKMLFWKRNRYENRVVLNNISFGSHYFHCGWNANGTVSIL